MGKIRNAWGAYEDWMRPIVEPTAKRIAGGKVEKLIGFFVMWHTLGGYRPMLDAGFEVTHVWRTRKEFAKVFGVEVDDAWPEFAAACREQGPR